MAFGDGVPAPEAAFVNGILIHARDFDDTHDVAIIHANASVLAAALAAAEAEVPVSGREFIAAVVVGIDIACRLGLSLRYYRGWHNSAVCGAFGAAAAASRVLGLDEKSTARALGIAYSQAAGNVQCIRDGALTKRIQLGFAAKAGVLSAFFARAGITGTTNTFNGPYGFLRLYDGPVDGDETEKRARTEGTYGEHELLAELGKRFAVCDLSMKPYPNSRAVHPAISGALDVCRSEKIGPGDVEQVIVAVSDRTIDRVGKPVVLGRGNLQVEAQFNLAYGIAVGICRGSVSLRDFEADRVDDPAVLAMAGRVSLVKNPAFCENLPVEVTIVARDGRRISRLVEKLRGAPDDPLSPEEMATKFHECCDMAVSPVSAERRQKIIGLVGRLEDVDDMRRLAALFH
jgi:2-methylcitrate dehydratase PrpD